MSEKTPCPVCSMFGVTALMASGPRGECPRCGLSGEVLQKLSHAHRAQADADLLRRYERLSEEVQKLRLENGSMRDALSEINGYLTMLKAQGVDL